MREQEVGAGNGLVFDYIEVVVVGKPTEDIVIPIGSYSKRVVDSAMP